MEPLTEQGSRLCTADPKTKPHCWERLENVSELGGGSDTREEVSVAKCKGLQCFPHPEILSNTGLHGSNRLGCGDIDAKT